MKKYGLGIILCALFISGCSIPLGSQQTNITPTPAAQYLYSMPESGNDVIGQVYKVKAESGDTVLKLCERYDIGAQQLVAANPHLGSGRVFPGMVITIPAQYILPPPNFRKGIVINIAEMRLYYFDKFNNTVLTFPVAVGREGWDTPLGSTYVYRKEEAPTWNVPKSIRDAYFQKTGQQHPTQVGPGPENPLGSYAIFLHMNGYLIHGNNAPATIGRRVSSGCIRMFNSDVAKLYDYVNRGTPVNFIYYPNKAGWLNGQLYLESHLPLGAMPVDSNPQNSATMEQAVNAALQQQQVTVNWQIAHQVVRRHSGILAVIGTKSNG